MSGHVRRTRCGIAVEEQEAASAGTARNGRDLPRGEDGRKRCRDISAGEAGENGCESIHAVAGLDQHRIPVGEARQGEAAGDPTGAVEESGPAAVPLVTGSCHTGFAGSTRLPHSAEATTTTM